MADDVATIEVRIAAADHRAASHGAGLLERARAEAVETAAGRGLRVLANRPMSTLVPGGDVLIVFLAVPA